MVFRDSSCNRNLFKVYTWGDNDEGQLGDGTTTGIQKPRLVTALQVNKRCLRTRNISSIIYLLYFFLCMYNLMGGVFSFVLLLEQENQPGKLRFCAYGGLEYLQGVHYASGRK